MDIQAARERCEAATKGDWFWNSYDSIWAGKGDDSERIASVSHLEYDDDGDEIYGHGDEIFGPRRAEARANAEFIAHARSDLPSALEALEEAQGKLRHQEPMIEWYKIMVEWFAQYVHSGESNQELLPRLGRILSKEGE